MTAYLLDTSIAIPVLRGQNPIAEQVSALLLEGQLAVPAPVLGELVHGAHASRDPDCEMTAVEGLVELAELLPFTEATAREYGRLMGEA